MFYNYIEYWLHDRIRSTWDREGEFRRIRKSLPDRLTRADVEAYQFFELRKTLRRAAEQSSHYRELFEKAVFRPEDIRDGKDLAAIPLLGPEQLAEDPYRFLCLSLAEIARPYTFITSGTTGPQKRIFWTRGDIERITDFMAAGMGMVADPGDVVLVLLPDGRPDSQADLLRQGCRKLGAAAVAADADLSAEEQLKILEDSRAAIIFGYSGRIFRLSMELHAKGLDLTQKGVKVLFLASEYLPECRRRFLESLWNCRVHTHYGLTEMGLGVAVECRAREGYHFNEADLLLEVVNPRTGEPAEAGEEGELVFTTLNREAMPLIRYRTHDISRLIPGPCPCGAATLLRFGPVRKRLEAIAVVGDGDEIFPALFDDALFEVPGLMDYQLNLTRRDNRDCLEFRIEPAQGAADIAPEIRGALLAMPSVARNIAAGSMIEPRVELLSPGALQSSSRAKKMIVDRR